MTFADAVNGAAQVIIDVQGETVTDGNGNELTVVFYPLTEKDRTAGGRRLNDHARGIIYPASKTFARGDRITQRNGTIWTILPAETLETEADAVGGLKRARVIYKGVVNG